MDRRFFPICPVLFSLVVLGKLGYVEIRARAQLRVRVGDEDQITNGEGRLEFTIGGFRLKTLVHVQNPRAVVVQIKFMPKPRAHILDMNYRMQITRTKGVS